MRVASKHALLFIIPLRKSSRKSAVVMAAHAYGRLWQCGTVIIRGYCLRAMRWATFIDCSPWHSEELFEELKEL